MSSETIRAIRFEAPYQVRAVQVPAPSRPAAGEVLVRTHSVGVCGTDASAYRGTFPFFDFPRIPGHELGVEVLEVGDGVTSVAAGDTCSVEPYLNCGRCYACGKGRSNCCERLSVIGVMQDGGLCDRFTLPADKLHRATDLTFDQLALVETLTIGCHAAARAALAQRRSGPHHRSGADRAGGTGVRPDAHSERDGHGPAAGARRLLPKHLRSGGHDRRRRRRGTAARTRSLRTAACSTW